MTKIQSHHLKTLRFSFNDIKLTMGTITKIIEHITK